MTNLTVMFKPKQLVSSNGSDNEPKKLFGINMKVCSMWIAIVFTVALLCGWFYLQLQIQAAVAY